MDWIQEPLERIEWSLLHWVAGIFWAIGDRMLLIGAVLINSARKLIVDPSGLINLVLTQLLQDPTGSQILKTYIAGAVLLALLLAAGWYILRPLIGQNIQSPASVGKVFAWLAVAGYLFTNGPALAGDTEAARAQLSSGAYQVAIAANAQLGARGYDNTHHEVPLHGSEPFGPVVQTFVNTTHVYNDPHTVEYTGIDVAAAFLLATQDDINGTANGGTGLPGGAERQYFCNPDPNNCYQPWPDTSSEPQRQAAITKALNGTIRMATGIVPSIFALIQSVIFLALAIAAAILLFSLPIALMFAFFNSTEVIALAVVKAYIGLFVKTYVTSVILAVFMGFLLFWANGGDANGTGNWVAFLGMSALTVFFTFQLSHMAVQTITQSLNTVTEAIGQATGTQAKHFDPIAMAGKAAGLAITAGTALATGGSSLIPTALASGLGEMGVPGAGAVGEGLQMGRRAATHRQMEDLRDAQIGQAAAITDAAASGAVVVALDLGKSARNQDQSDYAPWENGEEADRRRAVNNWLRQEGIPPITEDAPTTRLHERPVVNQAGNGFSDETGSLGGNIPALAGAGPSANGNGADIHPESGPSANGNGTGPQTEQGTQQQRDEVAALIRALVEMVRNPPATPSRMPPALQNLPLATQAALSGVAGRGYDPDDVAEISYATQGVVAGLRHRMPAAEIPGMFLGQDGRLDLTSPGVLEVLERAGAAGLAFSGSPIRNNDLAQVIGVSMGLEQVRDRAAIRRAIAHAAGTGGSADLAAVSLDAPPAVWGGSYGAVQRVIADAPLYGLGSPGAMESFIDLVEEIPSGELLAGTAELSAEQQALLTRARAASRSLAAARGAGQAAGAYGDRLLRSYIRDVQAVPTQIEVPFVPVGAPSSDAPVSSGRPAYETKEGA